MHIRKEEFFKPLKEADEEESETNGAALNDNMKNLCSDIIDQQMWVIKWYLELNTNIIIVITLCSQHQRNCHRMLTSTYRI